jgi:predicted lipoprotein
VRRLAAASPDEAGAKFGYRPKSGDVPWTFLVKLQGVVVEANTASRAATLSVDTTGKGKTDAIIQIGPAMRGTAIRDALDFVSFSDFTNQIDFARYGKAFNTYVDRQTLAKLPRDSLVGRKVTVVGAYPLTSAADIPLVTPVEITRAKAVTEARFRQGDPDVILRLESVSKVYSGAVAVKQADFEVRRGAVNVLVGENGAGKSTLMKIVAGVERPTAGRIVHDGEPVVFSGDSRRNEPRHRHGVPGTQPVRQSHSGGECFHQS